MHVASPTYVAAGWGDGEVAVFWGEAGGCPGLAAPSRRTRAAESSTTQARMRFIRAPPAVQYMLRRYRMKPGLVIAATALLTLASAGLASAQDATAKGQKVYTDQKCSMCHSIAGKGNTKGPLDNVGSKDSAADIRAWIEDAPGMTTKTGATRKPAMKAYSLPKSDVDSLVAYLSSLKK